MHPISIPHTMPPITFSFAVVFLFLTVIFIRFLPFIFYYDMISIERAYALSIVTSKVKMMKYNFIVSFFIFILSFSYQLRKALNFNIQGFLLFQI